MIDLFPLLFWGSPTLVLSSTVLLIYDYIKTKHFPETGTLEEENQETTDAEEEQETSPFQRGEPNPNIPPPEAEAAPTETENLATQQTQTPQQELPKQQLPQTSNLEPLTKKQNQLPQPPKKQVLFNWDEYEVATDKDPLAFKVKTLPNITFTKDDIDIAKLVEQELWLKKKPTQTNQATDEFSIT